MLAGNQPALAIAGQAVGIIGRLAIDTDSFFRMPLVAPVVGIVAEQQKAPVLPPSAGFPPHRPFRDAQHAALVGESAEAAPQPFHLLVGRDYPFEARTGLLNGHDGLLDIPSPTFFRGRGLG